MCDETLRMDLLSFHLCISYKSSQNACVGWYKMVAGRSQEFQIFRYLKSVEAMWPDPETLSEMGFRDIVRTRQVQIRQWSARREVGGNGGSYARCIVSHEPYSLAVQLIQWNCMRTQASFMWTNTSRTCGSFGISTNMSAERFTANNHGL